VSLSSEFSVNARVSSLLWCKAKVVTSRWMTSECRRVTPRACVRVESGYTTALVNQGPCTRDADTVSSFKLNSTHTTWVCGGRQPKALVDGILRKAGVDPREDLRGELETEARQEREEEEAEAEAEQLDEEAEEDEEVRVRVHGNKSPLWLEGVSLG